MPDKITAGASTIANNSGNELAAGAVQKQASGSMDDAMSQMQKMMNDSVTANASMLSAQMTAAQTNAQNGMAAQQAMAAQNQAESLNEAEIKMTNKATDGVKSAIS